MEPSARPTPSPTSAPAGTDRRKPLVLLADDEEPIRIISRRALEMAGYRVLTAADGTEAVRLYSQNPADVSVVVTDMAMPGMHGNDLIAALAALNPAVRVIIMSGYRLSEADGGPPLPPQVVGTLDKPFTAEQLIRTIIEILGFPSLHRPG